MTTTEALNKIASEEGYTDFIVLMANSNIGFITDRVEKAMIIYAKSVLAEIMEDGCGNIDTVQSIDDAIKTYKNIELK